jgi:hypothetical protein
LIGGDVAALTSEYLDGFRAGKKAALKVAEKELADAQKEMNYAKQKNSTFNPLTTSTTKVRRDTAKRVATALRKIQP